MKKLSCYIGLLMATLWLAACKSDTPLEPETTVGDGEQVLEITVDGDFYASSRSTAASAGYKLVSSQAIQHIEHLYAYIFNGSDRDATCVYVTEIPWEQNSQQGSASLTYRLKEANLPQYVTDRKPSDMQVLVVAVDNNTDTYNFPYDEETEHTSDLILGQPLSEVKLKLAEAAAGTTTSDADKAFKMANTEVFSGCTFFRADDQIIKVSLQRCVAGVLCYLTDIPYYVGSGTEEVNKISSIELQLGNSLNLNTEYVSFCDGETFGSAASNNNVIASVNISEYIYGKGTMDGTLYVMPEDESLTDKNTQRLYVPAMDNGVVKTKENTILFGAYLLPIKCENTATDDNATNATNATSTLKLVLKATGDNQTTFIVKNTVTSISGSDGTTNESEYDYSLKANRLYSIGSKPFATDTDADQPASLKGKEIELNVLEWNNGNKDGSNDVNFPVYSLKSTISADWNTQYANYIFNCMSETRTVYIYPSKDDAQSLNFKVQGVYSTEFENNPWVKFRFINEETGKPFEEYDGWYTIINKNDIPTELKEKTRMALEVRLNDYVKEKDILGNSLITDKKDALLKDFRTATLQLVNASDGAVLSSVPIQQFNAITYGNLGFSRLDYGATMGDNGKSNLDGAKIEWGFYDVYRNDFWNSFYVDSDIEKDGQKNYNNLKDKTSDCAIVKMHKEAIGYDGNIFWFLPAKQEIYDFVEKVREQGLISDLNFNLDYYWTSSAYYVLGFRYRYDAQALKISENEADIYTVKRDEYHYCRQAIKIPN